MTLKVGRQHRVLKYYQVYSNDDPGLTLTYFTAMSNLVPYTFVLGKGKTMNFSETLLVCDIKIGRCSQMQSASTCTFVNIKSQGHSLTFGQGHSDSTFSNFFS